MGSRSCSSMFSFMAAALQLVCMLSLLHGSLAQTSSCSISTLTPLAPCLPYIETGNHTTPGSDCCTPLASILNSSNPDCICQLASLSQGSNTVLNQTRALEVAASCNQTIPASVRSCLSGVGTAPVGTPPATPSTPSEGGGSSHGSTLLPPSWVLIGSIFVALSVHLSATA